MFFLSLIFLIPLIFYAVIPMGGAFLIRRNWMVFRRHLIDSFRSSIISFRNKSQVSSQMVRCYGRIQGYSKDRTIWVQTESTSLLADLKYCRFYQIATDEKKKLNSLKDFENIDFKRYRQMHWNEFQRLPEGSKLYMLGYFDPDSSRVRIHGTKKDPVYIVLYEGEDDTVISCSLWGGRQFNEAWNNWSLWSLPLGFFFMITLFTFYTRIQALGRFLPLTLTFTLLPLFLLLPPGLLFFLSYLKLWNIARLNRARRDLIMFYKYLQVLPDNEESSDYIFLKKILNNSKVASLKNTNRKINLMHFFSILCLVSSIVMNFLLFYPFIKRLF